MFGFGKVNKIHFRDFEHLTLSFKNANDKFKSNNIYGDIASIKSFTSKKRGDTLYITAKKKHARNNVSLFLTYDIKNILVSDSNIEIKNLSNDKDSPFRKANLPADVRTITLDNSKFITENLISTSVYIKLKRKSYFLTKNIMAFSTYIECDRNSLFKASDGYILKTGVSLHCSSKAIFEQGVYISEMYKANISSLSYMRCNVLDSIKYELKSDSVDIISNSINLYGIPKMEGSCLCKNGNERYFRPIVLETNIPEENDRVYQYKGKLDFSKQELINCYVADCVKMPKSISEIHEKAIEGVNISEKAIAHSVGFDYSNVKTKVLTKKDYEKVIKNFHTKIAHKFKEHEESLDKKEIDNQCESGSNQNDIINNATTTQKSAWFRSVAKKKVEKYKKESAEKEKLIKCLGILNSEFPTDHINRDNREQFINGLKYIILNNVTLDKKQKHNFEVLAKLFNVDTDGNKKMKYSF